MFVKTKTTKVSGKFNANANWFAYLACLAEDDN